MQCTRDVPEDVKAWRWKQSQKLATSQLTWGMSHVVCRKPPKMVVFPLQQNNGVPYKKDRPTNIAAKRIRVSRDLVSWPLSCLIQHLVDQPHHKKQKWEPCFPTTTMNTPRDRATARPLHPAQLQSAIHQINAAAQHTAVALLVAFLLARLEGVGGRDAQQPRGLAKDQLL